MHAIWWFEESPTRIADAKYIDLLWNFLSNFDSSKDASSLTKPMIMAEMYASLDVLPSPRPVVQSVEFWIFSSNLQKDRYTVWEIKKFSDTHILREIKLCKLES